MRLSWRGQPALTTMWHYAEDSRTMADSARQNWKNHCKFLWDLVGSLDLQDRQIRDDLNVILKGFKLFFQ